MEICIFQLKLAVKDEYDATIFALFDKEAEKLILPAMSHSL